MASSLVGKKIGNYNITRQLGEGGMGAVFLGEHPLIGKRVAVKVLHDDLAQKQDIVSRFFTEAKAVNDIHHENIVDIVDFGQLKDDDGKELVYFIMELLEGDGLSARLKRGAVAHEDTVHIMDQCASALAASHSHNIVHRDIKPDNIYLVTRGQDTNFVKLLDFGIAKLTGAGAASGMTRAGSVIGTPAYMSPEQCDGRGNIDHRSDIYSLGVVFFELLCGRVPFIGDGFGEVLVAQLTTPPPAPSSLVGGIPPALESIVLRCLEKPKETRFQTMDELRQALHNSGCYVGARPITGSMPLLSIPAGSTPGAEGTGSAAGRPTTLSGSTGELRPGTGAGAAPKSKALLFAALGALLVIGGGGAAFMVSRKEPPPAPVALPAPALPPKPVKNDIRILIDSTPQGAAIARAGQSEPIGKTPKELTLKKGEPPFDVLLTLEGFKGQTRTITTERDHDVLVALVKEEAAVPVVPKRTRSHESHSGEKKSSSPPPRNYRDSDGVLAPQL